MALKLMYITKDPQVARIAEDAGVDRIFLDMEYIGKSKRQVRRNSLINHHTPEDVAIIRDTVSKADVLVRVNSIHEAGSGYGSSAEEIEAVIRAGAQFVMLPYFKTVDEVQQFLGMVDGKAKTVLLLETPEAVKDVDEILALPGIDEIHIGINDLCLGYHKSFLFEMLIDGTVEKLCTKIREKGIPYGFGGIARLGEGALPAEFIIREHYRLGSTMVILSRTFCDCSIIGDYTKIETIFREGVSSIRELEAICRKKQKEMEAGTGIGYFEDNRREVERRVARICEAMGK